MDFKCKKCGGELIMETKTIGVCSYCKSRQTVSAIKGEKQVDLYQRAESFRLNSDFDQAAAILESMIENGQEDAELHWLLALCRYGIVYVEDPQTHKQMPTFYRLQRKSFLTDPDYSAAMKLAGADEKKLYQEQAQEIDRIQQQINQYMADGEQYDVFISYKETDKQGNRTQDSQIAHQIYNALTKENVRVFFSHITLENMLGEDYESVIYSALMSSKIMLLVTTSLENVEAPWVKNEWKRYLSLINQDNTRRLVPVLYGIKPEKLPAELSHLKLQALDFTRLGAIEDLVHSVKKVLKMEKKQTVQSQAAIDDREKVLRIAFFNLAEQKYEQAEDCCKDLLVRDPENARGHFCYFATEKRLPITSEQALAEFYKQMLNKNEGTEKPLETIVEVFASYSEDPHYQAAYKYGDREYKTLLDNTRKEIEKLLISKIDEKAAQAATAEDHYRVACMYGFFPDNSSAMQKKAEHVKIKDFTDAKEQYDNLIKKAERAVTFRDCMDVADMLSATNYQDSAARAEELRSRGCKLGYMQATQIAQSATSDADHIKALKIFEELAKYGYRESARKMKEEQRAVFELRIKEAKKYAELHPTAEGYLTAADMLKSIDFDEARKDEEKYKKLAIKAAKSRNGTFSQKAVVKKSVAAVCTILALVLIGVWVMLLISNSFNDIIHGSGRPYTNDSELFISIGLIGLAFGIIYGFVSHFCPKKRLFCFLLLAAMVLFPIAYGLTDHTIFQVPYSSTLRSNGLMEYVPYLFGGLMLPGFIAACFIANANWQSLLKAAGWIVGLFILALFVVQVDFGAWGDSLQRYHRSLSEVMQIAFFPIICIIGAVVFGIGGKITKVNRLLDVLFVAAMFSLVFFGPNLIWKTDLYNKIGISKQLFLAVLLTPSLIVFRIPRL